MTGVPSDGLQRYFAEARRWDQDRLSSALRGRRLAWIVAGAATLLATASSLAVVALTPLKTSEPFVIRVDRSTGAVDVVRGLSAGTGPARYEEAVSKYFLAQYVRTREGYLDPAAEDAFRMVSLLSAPDEQTRWADLYRGSNVLVAHNCDFERGFIKDAHTGVLPWICTYKGALRVWPEAPRHSNQVLRYWRGHELDPALAMPPHRAGPDAWVTAHILNDLLAAASVEDLVQWTREPRLLPRIPFGKHRGSAWSEAPADYLQWMARQSDMDPDTVWNARRELERRAAD